MFMLRLLIDQDFDHDILRGLMRRVPNLDVVTAHDIGLSAATDPELLAWAAEAGRIIIPLSASREQFIKHQHFDFGHTLEGGIVGDEGVAPAETLRDGQCLLPTLSLLTDVLGGIYVFPHFFM
jgi:hypothetical protein